MKAPLSWLRDYAALPDGLGGRGLAEQLIRAGLEVETVEHAGADVSGPLVVGRVLSSVDEPQKNGKIIRWCRVDVGSEHNQPADDQVPASRGIVCGAHNFAVGDLVVVALPGAVLTGEFTIAARKTYGHLSDGMICSARELGLGEDHDGIIVLAPAAENGPEPAPGADAAPILHLRDEVLDIAVTPDRGYCLSLRGLAREAAQATGTRFRDPVDKVTPTEATDGHPVRLESPACPLFVAVSVSGVDPSQPTPRWLARRVQLAGMRSISLTVDITNYVMLETGQPIHAYDAESLDGTIVVRTAQAGETLTTLDDTVRELDADDLLITDGSGPIGLAGVMGGASTEISPATTSVVIEAAHFDAMTIARTSRRHRLSSEASRRFERGVDPAAAYAAAHRVAALLAELAGGTIERGETVAGAVPATPSLTIDADLPSRILGTEVSADTAVALLEAVGASVAVEGEQLTVTPPTWRPDLTDPYDYVEEVGRLVGYDSIEPTVPRAPVGRGLTTAQKGRRAVTAAVVAAGFVEVLSLPFLSVADLDSLGVAADDRRRRLNRIANPLAETSPYLRTTLLPGLFAAVARNRSRGNDDLAIFETGSVFYAAESAAAAPRPPVTRRPTADQLAAMDAPLGQQPRHLAAVLTGSWRTAGWVGPVQPAGWQQAISAAEIAARALGVTLTRRAVDRPPWHPGRCAELSTTAGEVVGYAGELHPQVITAYGLPERTAAVEIDLSALLEAAPPRSSVVPISTYPVAKEDVALIVGSDVPAATVQAALRRGAGPLLESVELFDVYTGPQVGDGRKSLAFALRFRASDRTLTDAESGSARDAAVAAASEEVAAEPRVLQP
ncbi:MAG: phenylalanine--tRNA ligase subunit beta [Microlunatus sp.]|nr:phenylalanine--tRNA ligase subunit beta [Microlunatus sp.]